MSPSYRCQSRLREDRPGDQSQGVAEMGPGPAMAHRARSRPRDTRLLCAGTYRHPNETPEGLATLRRSWPWAFRDPTRGKRSWRPFQSLATLAKRRRSAPVMNSFTGELALLRSQQSLEWQRHSRAGAQTSRAWGRAAEGSRVGEERVRGGKRDRPGAAALGWPWGSSRAGREHRQS